MRARIVSMAATVPPRAGLRHPAQCLSHIRVGCAWLAMSMLLACDAEAHIRLFEPDPSEPALDAGPPAAPPGDGGAELPGTAVPNPAAPDPELPDPELPDPEAPDAEVPDPLVPDAALLDAGSAPTSPAADALVLRYDFSGDGDVVPDLVGDRDARLLGGTLLEPSRTFINLDGVDDYVDLPNGVVSELRSATFVVWLSWVGGVCWQRIFDFGISDQGEDQVGNAVTSLFMTPLACGDQTFTVMAELGATQHPVSDDEALPSGYALQVALVVDADTQSFTLYRDTEKVAEAPAPFELDQLTDANNWLGRSQWAQDGFFAGAIGEFRIYSRVLTADEIAQVRAEGFETP
jgi:hypothetical protein